MNLRHAAGAAMMGAFLLLAGCSPMDLSDFADREPAMVPERFFAGELRGWGLEFGPLGGIGRRIEVEATGSFDEVSGVLTLDETYRFDDGHGDRLRWQIRRLGDGRYEAVEARAAEPGEGQAAGSVFRLTYRRDVPQTDGSSTVLSFDDWFIRIDRDTVMVRATISKLALPLGSMTVLYRRVDAAPVAEPVPAAGD
jgi:hypothetical protein